MIETAKHLEALLSHLVKPEGFHRDGRNWRRDMPELIMFINLQRSRGANKFYVNIGALVKALGNEPWIIRDRARPRIEEAHYQIRLEQLFGDVLAPPDKVSPEVEQMHALLDLETTRIDPQRRNHELTAIIQKRLIPFLRLCKDEAGLRTAIVSVVRNAIGTSGVLRDRFRLTPGPLESDS